MNSYVGHPSQLIIIYTMKLIYQNWKTILNCFPHFRTAIYMKLPPSPDRMVKYVNTNFDVVTRVLRNHVHYTGIHTSACFCVKLFTQPVKLSYYISKCMRNIGTLLIFNVFMHTSH